MSPTTRQHTFRRVTVFSAGVLAAASVVYVGLATGGSDQVPADTLVMGHNIGGLAEQEAAAYLRRHVGRKASQSIELRVGKRQVQVSPADLGLAFDPVATVAEVTGSRWNPMLLARRFVGTSQIDPVVRVDRTKLHNVVAGLAVQFDTLPENADVLIRDGEAQLVEGSDGLEVDQAASEAAIVDAFLRPRKPVVLPTQVVRPAVTTAEARTVLTDVAEPAIAEPVTIRGTSKSGSASGTYNIDGVLAFNAVGSQLVPVINGDELHSMIEPEFAAVEIPGRDATISIRKGKPVVVASKVGYGVKPDALADSVVSVLTKTGADRTVNVTLGPVSPELTTAKLRALGIRNRMAQYVQNFPYAPYRVQNIGQAAKYIDGTLLKPGDEFSMNDTIRERTVENGYTKGFVVGEGGVLKMDEGGGVSTATTAMYNAAWFAGLEFVQHRAHSIWISRYKPGREATVSWGDFDMKFKNNTDHGIYIQAKMTDESITVTLWGDRQWQKVGSEFGEFSEKVPFQTLYSQDKECHAQTGVDGFLIDVDRTFYRGGKVVKTETYSTRYKPSPTVICGIDPNAPIPVPTPEPSPSASPSAEPSATPDPTIPVR